MIKQGEVVFVKISGDPVYVLEVEENVAHCRRYNIGQNGSDYVTTSFFPGELETRDEFRKRIRLEQQELVDKYGPKPGAIQEFTA